MLQLRGTLCEKSFIVALAALAATASFAQSSVTIWGIVDAGVQSAKQNGVSKTQLTTSGLSSSQLGFRGTEDLGGGMSASFWMEGTLVNDAGTPAGLQFGRRSTLDLAGNFGAIRLGRDYTPTFWNHTVFDAFGTLGSGAGSNITLAPSGSNAATAARTSNGVSYLYGFANNAGSAVGKGGVYAQVTHAFGEQLSTAAAQTNQYQGARVGYINGPMNVAVSTGNTVVSASAKDKHTNIAGSYDLGVAKLMVLNSSFTNGTTNAKVTANQISAQVPMGSGYIPVSYATAKNSANDQKGSQFAIGYVHNLSKRTALYGTYSSITNKNGAGYTFLGGNGGYGAGLTAGGANGTGMDIGVRHTF